MDAWAYKYGVKLLLSRPGKLTDNGYIKSFDGRLRHEHLNQHLPTSIEDAKEQLEAWRPDYNHHRPHSAFGNRSLSEYENSHTKKVSRKSGS